MKSNYILPTIIAILVIGVPISVNYILNSNEPLPIPWSDYAYLSVDGLDECNVTLGRTVELYLDTSYENSLFEIFIIKIDPVDQSEQLAQNLYINGEFVDYGEFRIETTENGWGGRWVAFTELGYYKIEGLTRIEGKTFPIRLNTVHVLVS